MPHKVSLAGPETAIAPKETDKLNLEELQGVLEKMLATAQHAEEELQDARMRTTKRKETLTFDLQCLGLAGMCVLQLPDPLFHEVALICGPGCAC